MPRSRGWFSEFRGHFAISQGHFARSQGHFSMSQSYFSMSQTRPCRNGVSSTNRISKEPDAPFLVWPEICPISSAGWASVKVAISRLDLTAPDALQKKKTGQAMNKFGTCYSGATRWQSSGLPAGSRPASFCQPSRTNENSSVRGQIVIP